MNSRIHERFTGSPVPFLHRILTERVFLVSLAGFLFVSIGPFVTDTYMMNAMIKAFFFGIAAITVDMLWGYAGYLTFGQSAFFGIGAYAAGLVFTYQGFSSSSILLAFSAAAGVACLVGVFVGWLSFYRNAAPFFASIVSLVLPIAMSQIALSGGSFTGSSSGLTGFESFDFSMEAWFRIAGYSLLICGLLGWMIVHSDAGRVLISIRDNSNRCAYLGINTSSIKIVLLASCAVVASLAGFGYGSFSCVVAPELMGFSLGTEFIVWVALSGRGTLWGPLVGTVLLNVATTYLSGVMPFMWQLLLGFSFVLVIVFLPDGLIPLLARPFAVKKNDVPELVLVPARKFYPGDERLYAIEMNKVSKKYGTLSVLRNVTLYAGSGELIGVIGPNGAGKTTLMRCVSDGEERTGGTVRLYGNDIGRLPPEQCVKFGLGRKFQNADIFHSLTVAECLRMARVIKERPSLWKKGRTLALPPYALDVLHMTGLDGKLGVQAKDLSHGERQALELAMVLALEPRVVLLDEPTSGLTRAERIQIGTVLVSLAHDYRLCCLLVEHDLDFVKEIATRVIVLHQGAIAMQDTVENVVNSELVRSIYAGSAVSGEPA
ncbi:MAG: ATP-binding cassette domain-containing protein [Desulfovibrio sp.]|jgi:branched-chain amino acid transport system permease protein|nr:ATP-binding cassette domain-containing protein [Desulfovibrio sp.]